MKLTQKQIKYLKGLGHHLKPVVSVGKEGLSEAVLAELNATLTCHELIKVKVAAEEREDFQALVGEIVAGTRAVGVQTIGRMAILYRENVSGERLQKKRTKIMLPSA